MKRAFTLIELLVVIAIIVIVIAMGVISVPALIGSSSKTQAISCFKSSVITAKTLAEFHGTSVAMRIERAFETDKNSQALKDASGTLIFKDHQQIRTVIFGFKQGPPFYAYDKNNKPVVEYSAYVSLRGTGINTLPKQWWLCPDNALTDNIDVWLSDNIRVSKVNPFETFYVVFDRRGNVKIESDIWLNYFDETQIYFDDTIERIPLVKHPYPSSRDVILYERNQYPSSLKDGVFLSAVQ